MNVKSIAGRILCEMSAYIDLRSETDYAPSWWIVNGNLNQDDIYGIYQGRGGGANDAIVVGKKGLYIFSDRKWTLLHYKSIEIIPPLKDCSDGLFVRVSDQEIKLPVNDCLSDIFEFWRFIMRSQEFVEGEEGEERTENRGRTNLSC